MGTNFIGLALRDVGAGFSDLLRQQAERQNLANQQQVNLGQLGLRGQELQNQAAVDQARAGVSLAEVATKGRFQDRTLDQGQDRIQIERDTLAATKDYQTNFQGPALAASARAAEATAAAAGANARTSARAQQAQAPVYAAQAREVEAQADLHNLQRQQLQRKVDLGQRPVDFEETLTGFDTILKTQLGPELGAQASQGMRSFLTLYHGDQSKLPVDKTTGRRIVPMDEVLATYEIFKPIWQAAAKQAVPIDQQLKIITETFGKQSDAQQAKGLPAYAQSILPYFKDYQGYTSALQAFEQTVEGVGGIRETLEADYRANHKLAPTVRDAQGKVTRPGGPIPKDALAEIQKAVELARDQGQQQIQTQILAGTDVPALLKALPGGSVAPPVAPPPAVTIPGSAGAPPAGGNATAAPPVLQAGTPAYVAHLYRRRAMPQAEALQVLQTKHGLTKDQAFAVLYPRTEDAVTDALRGYETPALSARDIYNAVQAKKIGKESGVKLLVDQLRLSRTSALDYLESPQP